MATRGSVVRKRPRPDTSSCPAGRAPDFYTSQRCAQLIFACYLGHVASLPACPGLIRRLSWVAT